jgi:RNA polymerase sigma-70 factor (ECF subfamily)
VEAFLAEWTPRLFRFAIRLTGDVHHAEDLTQEAMLRAWRQRSTVRSEAALKTWLFTIAANLWRDQVRRRRSPIARSVQLPESAANRDVPVDRALGGQEELGLVLAQLDALPPRQREAIYLNACEGLKASEIALILDASPEAVRSSLSLARKKLRECLSEKAVCSPLSEHSQ